MREEHRFVESVGTLEESPTTDNSGIISQEEAFSMESGTASSNIEIDIRKMIIYSEIMNPKYLE